MNLDSLLIKDDAKKISDVLYDKDWKVSFKLMHLEKTEIQAMIGRHTKTGWNKKHQQEEQTDNEALTKEIIETCVKGWKGVTFKWLATKILIDLSKVEKPEAEITFNKANLEFVMKHSTGIDSWILESVREATNFTTQQELERKN